MREVVSLTCTNCGGEVRVNDEGRYQCQYCKSILYFDNLQRFDDNTENYVVTAGKLEKYTGTAVALCIPACVTVIGAGVFANLEGLESVILPPALQKIESDAFFSCKSLKEIVIPASVKHIGERAFKNSGLVGATLPCTLDFFGAEAFMQCENLTKVRLLKKLPSECRRIFKQCPKLADVHVERDLVAPSFVPAIETKKPGDERPTYFDLFQGTPFFEEKSRCYARKECIFCGGAIDGKNICTSCNTQYYKKASGGCYVATCVYGSYDCPEVWTLRRYRDDTLSATWYGRLFIRAYYAVSPTLVRCFGRTVWFQKLFRGKLDRMVAALQAEGVAATPYEDKDW